VLTATILGFGVVIAQSVSTGTGTLAGEIGPDLTSIDPGNWAQSMGFVPEAAPKSAVFITLAF
jgi:hypothetical protein